MNREAFEYLYIHANSLAELALDQLALDLEQSMAAETEMGVPDLPPLSVAERDAQVAALFSRMDTASMMDAWKGGPEFEAQVLRGIEQLQQADATRLAVPADSSVPADETDESHEGQLNLALYLQRAYAVQDQISARVDDGMLRLDLAKLDALLSALPNELAPLTSTLNADDLAQWLTYYQTGNDALDQIVVLIRALNGESV